MLTAIFIFNLLVALVLGVETIKVLWMGKIKWPEDVPEGEERPECSRTGYPRGYWKLIAFFVLLTMMFAVGAAATGYSLFFTSQS